MKANEIVATGNYTTQVEIISRDEAGLLSESFNNMVDKIRVQQEELLDYSRTLEDKVRERTAQLAAEKAKSDNLLLNILPVSIAERLKKKKKQLLIDTMKSLFYFQTWLGLLYFQPNILRKNWFINLISYLANLMIYSINIKLKKLRRLETF